jgi:hypothetical protein
MPLYKNCGWWKTFDCIFGFSVKRYVRNTINLSWDKILLTSVIFCLFPKLLLKSVPESRETQFLLSCGYSIYMAKAVLEYFVRSVVTNSLKISFQRSVSTVLTTNRVNAMIRWRDCNWYHFLVFIKCFAYFFLSLAINSYYWATITSN